MELQPKLIRAPELFGDFWFNSDPLSVRALRGYVMLIDFWDYSCVNCQRTLPYLNEWHRRYRELGLVMVGVHTPEFHFGRKPENVQCAIRAAGIEYPVVMDNEAFIWSAYANRSWPTHYLIDKDGYIRYTQHGEGQYQAFERAIQALLRETGVQVHSIPLMEPLRDADQPGAVCYRPTNEIYIGYLRGTIGNVEGYQPESTIHYTNPGLYLSNRFYADGAWLSEKEFLRFNGQPGGEGSLVLSYESLEVNAVLDYHGGGSSELRIEQDGMPLSIENKGEDIRLTAEGMSVVEVTEPRMYNLVRNPEFGEHVLKLSTASPHIEFYSFTFTTCAIPELLIRN